jgi:hypothetical protein
MASSTMQLLGQILTAGGRRTTNFPLTNTIDRLEVKPLEITVPAGGGATVVPLALSTGVTEALVIALYTSRRLDVTLTDSNGDTVTIGVKGTQLLTMYPGKGITAISASNPSSSDEQLLEYIIGTLGPDGVVPDALL